LVRPRGTLKPRFEGGQTLLVKPRFEGGQTLLGLFCGGAAAS
jgi:hypothetical protein